MSDHMRDKDSQERIFSEIIEFLRQLGWPSESLSSKVIRTFYKSQFGVSEVIIHIGTQDVCLVIDPVVERKHGDSWGDSVSYLIEAMAEEIKHIGIGIDEDGDLFVKVHLPFVHINLEHFHCLLIGMCQVADNMLLPVLQANAFDNLKVA